MRGGSTVQQSLSPEAASVVGQAVGLAQQRGHAQVTPLHVASIMLSSSGAGSLFRAACLRSHSHPLRCKALELCFNVSLNRLPAAAAAASPSSSSCSLLGPYSHHHHHFQRPPGLSNALVAAFKRAQAHQRRGSVEAQQQPLLVVKIELHQLVLSILDDPSVSRVMREAGFSSTQVKCNVEQSMSPTTEDSYALSPLRKKTRSLEYAARAREDDVDGVMDSLARANKQSGFVLVAENLATCESVMRRIMERAVSGDVPQTLRSLQLTSLSLSSFERSSRLEVEEKTKELSNLVKGRSSVIYLGDLTGFKIDDCGDHKEGSLRSSMEHAVMELGRLLSHGVDGGKIWVVGIATSHTYRSSISWLRSLGVLDVEPLFVPGGGLDLSLSVDSIGVDRHVRGQGLGVEPSWQLEVRERNKSFDSSDWCNMVKEPQRTRANDGPRPSTCLPSWLQKLEKGGISSADTTDTPKLADLCKWSTSSNSNQPKKTLNFSWSSPSSSIQGKEKDSCHEFNFWMSRATHKDHDQDLMTAINNEKLCVNMSSSSDSMEVIEHAPKFKELSAENLKTLCSALEEQVPWQKHIISDIASTILQCRSGMRRRKEQSEPAEAKQETWLLFQGSDFEGKVKIAMELARLVFGSYTDFIPISSEASHGPHGYLERFAEAIRDNPHSVILMEDMEQVDYKMQEGIMNAIGSGRIKRSRGEEIGVSDAIIILTCESFEHTSSSACSSPTAKPRLNFDDEKDAKDTHPFVLDLNLSAPGDVDGVEISELVDRTIIFKLPEHN
ncbi:protein SMAX1-LIKE 3-like [Curcuma longa]|uniref:protein SMAX1-LIKE 3-like n=1 Tax=Curcuma longa TaxID=136217 RepID=UPI003D9F4B33